MEYIKLNKARHATKNFTGEKVPTVDVKQIISAATLAPSAHNMQTWHFVIVESPEKREALLSEVKPNNREQVSQAGAVIVLFSDTDLIAHSKEIVEIAGAELNEEQQDRFNTRYPQMFETYSEAYKNSYLSINIGLVAMNLVLAIKNYGYDCNIVLGFERTPKVNELLDVDKRYRPELIIPLGLSDAKGEPSYRLPQERIVEIK